MARISRQPTTKCVEIAIVQHLKKYAALKGCAVVAKGDGVEAPEQLPCIIVHCSSAPRHSDIIGFYARDAEVSVTLYADSEQTTETKCNKYAEAMETCLDWVVGLKKQFNAPTSGRDYRKIRGVYLHEIIDFSTEYDTEGTIWQRSANLTMVVQEIDE
jgi:hypothetical protein